MSKITDLGGARHMLWALKRIAHAVELIVMRHAPQHLARECKQCGSQLARRDQPCPICGGKP